MSPGLRLSFRVHETTFWNGLAIVILVTAGLLLPVALGTWYIYGGASRSEHRQSLQMLIDGDPLEAARRAIEQGDLRMFLVRGGLDKLVPGVGAPDDDYRETYGYRAVLLLGTHEATADDEHLNDAVLAYTAAYNRVVAAHVAGR